MRTKYKRLTGSDYKNVLDLYAESCHKDKFYCQLFRVSDCYAEIKKFFADDVWCTLQCGYTVGAFAGKQLVGILLGFNVQQWYNHNRKEFDHVFNFDGDSGSYWFNAVNDYLSQINKRCIYTYTICVDEHVRRKGVASEMIRHMCKECGREFAMISDATHPAAMAMWFKNGFKEVRLGDKDNEVVLLVNEGSTKKGFLL